MVYLHSVASCLEGYIPFSVGTSEFKMLYIYIYTYTVIGKGRLRREYLKKFMKVKKRILKKVVFIFFILRIPFFYLLPLASSLLSWHPYDKYVNVWIESSFFFLENRKFYRSPKCMFGITVGFNHSEPQCICQNNSEPRDFGKLALTH